MLKAQDLLLRDAFHPSAASAIVLKDVEIGWVRRDDAGRYVFACPGVLGDLYRRVDDGPMEHAEEVLERSAIVVNRHWTFFSGWFTHAVLARDGVNETRRREEMDHDMATEVTKVRLPRIDDPLGCDEDDVVERLHAMADDALAGRHREAVAREVETARRAFGFDG